jgi:hypothetical protein
MWRGPVWGFTNWLVMEALHVQGKDDAMRALLDSWVRCRSCDASGCVALLVRGDECSA